MTELVKRLLIYTSLVGLFFSGVICMFLGILYWSILNKTKWLSWVDPERIWLIALAMFICGLVTAMIGAFVLLTRGKWRVEND